jgi:hypothetical protein
MISNISKKDVLFDGLKYKKYLSNYILFNDIILNVCVEVDSKSMIGECTTTKVNVLLRLRYSYKLLRDIFIHTLHPN